MCLVINDCSSSKGTSYKLAPAWDYEIHGQITGRWTTFLNSGTKTYKEIEDFVKIIDDELGHKFLPPIR